MSSSESRNWSYSCVGVIGVEDKYEELGGEDGEDEDSVRDREYRGVEIGVGGGRTGRV